MPKLHQIIERHWQQPDFLLTLLLKPLSVLFGCLARHRRNRYLSGKTKSIRLPVPVVIIGNIHAGGVGKTPIAAALVSALMKQGITVGIVSRGYGRKQTGVHLLHRNSTAAEAGDEPLLLYRKTGAPTAVGSNRPEAAQALLDAHPDIQLIVADDGLQHYALHRDLEIIVFPATDTGRLNLDLLPNGSLREPLERLQTADAVVISGNGETYDNFRPSENIFRSRIAYGGIYRFRRPEEKWHSGRLKNSRPYLAAVAGIAKPQRFFDALAQSDIRLNETVALADHADIHAGLLPKADAVFITEKDAVKFSDGPELENVWVLPVYAIIEPDLAVWIAGRLKIKPQEKNK